MKQEESRGRIHLLRDTVARQIAAGEVIDRPFSIVRELLDNSIDAGATAIDVYLEAGGVASVRVVDDGSGMSKEDLELCWHSHATSKIESVEDLDHLSSLGFRGEALSSIAACTRLSITSRSREAASAHRLRVDSGKLVSLSEAPGEIGSLVEAADLFYALPARRRFLKTASAETTMCRTTLIEKGIAFPSVAFRLFTGGELKHFLPAVSTLDERVAAAHPSILDPGLMHRIEARRERFSITVVAGGPSLYRRDRRYIWTYVNNRRINEYPLIQAVEYGFADQIPGGTFPIAFVFISVDPDLVDFNVHPAKREARFRNMGEIHHALVVALKEYLQRFSVSFTTRQDATAAFLGGSDEEDRRGDRSGWPSTGMFTGEGETPAHPRSRIDTPPGSPGRGSGTPVGRGSGSPVGRGGAGAEPFPDTIRRLSGELEPRPAPGPSAGDIRFYGQVFRLFLLASVGDRLFILDQHAAHERVLFERLRSNPGPPQNLLVPISFEATPDEERQLEANIQFCASVGIGLVRVESGRWEVSSLPEGFRSLEEEVVAFCKQAKGTKRELEQELYARMSCRAAIKEGDGIDEITAVELIRRTFELENARCPHGRPIWYELSREELLHLVGRL